MPQLKFALTQQGSLPHASIPLVVSDSLAATSSTYTINKNHHNRLLGTMAHCQTQPNNQSSSRFGENLCFLNTILYLNFSYVKDEHF